jgi:hypothetical protein
MSCGCVNLLLAAFVFEVFGLNRKEPQRMCIDMICFTDRKIVMEGGMVQGPFQLKSRKRRVSSKQLGKDSKSDLVAE